MNEIPLKTIKKERNTQALCENCRAVGRLDLLKGDFTITICDSIGVSFVEE